MKSDINDEKDIEKWEEVKIHVGDKEETLLIGIRKGQARRISKEEWDSMIRKARLAKQLEDNLDSKWIF